MPNYDPNLFCDYRSRLGAHCSNNSISNNLACPSSFSYINSKNSALSLSLAPTCWRILLSLARYYGAQLTTPLAADWLELMILGSHWTISLISHNRTETHVIGSLSARCTITVNIYFSDKV